MKKPFVTIVDAQTGAVETREMTDQEYADLIASGWTPGDEPTLEPEEETPKE